MFNIITLDELKAIELKSFTHWWDQYKVNEQIYLDTIINSNRFGNGPTSPFDDTSPKNTYSWDQLLTITERGRGFCVKYEPCGRGPPSHEFDPLIRSCIRFVDTIRSIWNSNKHQPISTESISYVQYNQLKQTTDDLQQQLNLANQKIAMLTSEFHFEFNLLKQQNAELRCRRNGYPIAMAVPVAASAPVDLNDTKVHLARSISTQNLSDWQDQ
jgi:hypothetical protein